MMLGNFHWFSKPRLSGIECVVKYFSLLNDTVNGEMIYTLMEEVKQSYIRGQNRILFDHYIKKEEQHIFS